MGPLAPTSLRLDPPVPNPFDPARGAASVRFALAAAGNARVEVFDPAGRRVATLLQGPLPAGEQLARWSGAGDDGARAPSGLYFVRVEADPAAPGGGRALVRRLLLLR